MTTLCALSTPEPDDIKQELLDTRAMSVGVLKRGGTYVLGLEGGSSFEAREVMAAFLQGVLLPLVEEGAYYPSRAFRDEVRSLSPCLLPADIAEVLQVFSNHGVLVRDSMDFSGLKCVRRLDLRVVAARPLEYFCYQLVPFCSLKPFHHA